MKVILFGATGMVGQGALRECLLDPEVTAVLAVGRAATGQTHPKLRELVHKNLYDYAAIMPELEGYDACLFCLGVSSAGMKEDAYTKITYDLTLAAARALLKANPQMTFLYVSGMSTDSTEKGRAMWARVKGKTENELLRLGFRDAYMIRPGGIQPMYGIKSKTKLYQTIYTVAGPLFWLASRLSPNYVTTTEKLGRAMVRVAKHGAATKILENGDLNALGAA